MRPNARPFWPGRRGGVTAGCLPDSPASVIISLIGSAERYANAELGAALCDEILESTAQADHRQ